jgi:hypothetical protein
MDTSPAKAGKAPQHFKTRRSHDAVVLFFFFPVVDNFLAPFRSYRSRILDALLDLLLGLDASFDIFDDFYFFFLDRFFFAELDLCGTDAVPRRGP